MEEQQSLLLKSTASMIKAHHIKAAEHRGIENERSGNTEDNPEPNLTSSNPDPEPEPEGGFETPGPPRGENCPWEKMNWNGKTLFVTNHKSVRAGPSCGDREELYVKESMGKSRGEQSCEPRERVRMRAKV